MVVSGDDGPRCDEGGLTSEEREVDNWTMSSGHRGEKRERIWKLEKTASEFAI